MPDHRIFGFLTLQVFRVPEGGGFVLPAALPDPSGAHFIRIRKYSAGFRENYTHLVLRAKIARRRGNGTRTRISMYLFLEGEIAAYSTHKQGWQHSMIALYRLSYAPL